MNQKNQKIIRYGGSAIIIIILFIVILKPKFFYGEPYKISEELYQNFAETFPIEHLDKIHYYYNSSFNYMTYRSYTAYKTIFILQNQSNIIAHEVFHTWQNHHIFGAIKLIIMNWKEYLKIFFTDMVIEDLYYFNLSTPTEEYNYEQEAMVFEYWYSWKYENISPLVLRPSTCLDCLNYSTDELRSFFDKKVRILIEKYQ